MQVVIFDAPDFSRKRLSAEVCVEPCFPENLQSDRRRSGPLTILLSLAILLLQLVKPSFAQSEQHSVTSEQARISRLEQKLDLLEEANHRLEDEIRDLKTQSSDKDSSPTSTSPIEVSPHVQESLAQIASAEPYRVTYDQGFAILPKSPEDTPFSLKINSQNIFRYEGFQREKSTWTDSAGNQNRISDTSSFQIPRGRLILSGMVFDPNLSYLFNIDYNTVNSNPIGFRAYELSYRFSRAFELHVGQSKVPGTREWLESGFAPLEGPDRSMATTFFRPSLSQGVWITGNPLEGVHYHAMMSNGFNTLNLSRSQLNNRFCWSGSSWWEPWGDYGRGYADLENHAEPVIRLGSSYTFALGQGSQSDSDAVENSSIRLSDGTVITQLGALAPGVTLQSYDVSLGALDVSLKYRGLSLSTEWFAQDLSSLKGNGPLPLSSTQAYGGFVQGGYFVLPQTLEVYSRGSFVTGRYGSGSETAGGINWFVIPGKSHLRFTIDAAWLESSPASQNRTGYEAGQTGILVRTQITATY